MKEAKKKEIGDSREFWTDYSEDYFQNLYKDVKEYPALIVRHRYILDLFDKDGGNVLDIGCGPGEMAIDLEKRGCSVQGVDISEGMIDVARKNVQEKCPDGNIDLHVGNIEKLQFDDEEFDTVICSGVIEYLTIDDKALSEMWRVLKKDGTLIVTVRNKICPPRIIDIFTDTIKETKAGLSVLNKIKKSLHGKDTPEIVFTPYRKHYPWEIDSNLKRYGLIKKDFRYYHFYPFFVPFDKLFPSFFIKAGLKMEKLTTTILGWLASGYIVKARKK